MNTIVQFTKPIVEITQLPGLSLVMIAACDAAMDACTKSQQIMRKKGTKLIHREIERIGTLTLQFITQSIADLARDSLAGTSLARFTVSSENNRAGALVDTTVLTQVDADTDQIQEASMETRVFGIGD